MPGRFEAEPSGEAVVSPHPARSVPSAEPAPLEKLARAWRLLLVAAAAGALAAAGAARMARTSYRAVARVLVVEPRLGPGAAVDFNLTPIRSYAALLTSPSIAGACADSPSGGDALARRLRVRVPENTRLLEVALADADAARAAAAVNCVVARAAEENRKVNAELASRGADAVDAALERSRAAIGTLETQLASARGGAGLELKRQELKSALQSVEASAEEERAARISLAQAAARRKSFSETAAGRTAHASADATRELAEKGAAEAAADEAAARSAVEAAAAGRAQATARAAALEQRIAADEGAVGAVTRRLDAASAARTDLEKRRASVPLEAASKAFELVAISPAVAPSAPERVPSALAGAAGAVSALLVAGLVVLARE